MRKELSARMDKQDEKIDKLADKIDGIKDTIVTPTFCERMNITALVAVAFGVLYAIFFK